MTDQNESLHFLDYWRVIRSRKEVIIAVSLLVVLTGILVTYSMPKVYRASAIIAVRQDGADLDIWKRQMSVYDPLFMRTQYEIIKSRPVFEETIRKLDLDRKLSTAYGYAHLPDHTERTVKLLSKSTKVAQYRDTNLIEIQAYLAEPKDAAPEEAANVANTIATVFRDSRQNTSREERERALKALYATLQDQQKRVESAQMRVEQIRTNQQINIVAFTSAREEGGLEASGLLTLDSYRRRARVDLAETESRMNQLMSLPPEDLVAAAQGLGDLALQQLVADKRKAEVEARRAQQTYGAKHPTVLDAMAAVQEIDKKIADQIEGMKTNIRVKYEADKAKLAIIENEMEDLKKQDRSRTGTAYLEFRKAQEDLDHAKEIRNSLEVRYLQEQIEMRIPRTIVEVIQPAQAPSGNDPVSPNVTLNLVLSIIVGIGSGIALAYFIEYLDTSVKTVEDVEKSMGLPVLGVIPQKVRPLVDEEADAAHAEAYRILRTNIRFSKRLKEAKCLTITSGSAGEGKSLTLFNLAYASARLGERVLIVDSDLHRPVQHKLLGVTRDVGLANVLVGQHTADEVIVQTKVPNVFLMPSGRLSGGHHGLLDTLRIKQLITELKQKFDLVLFDSPPITGVSDASLLAREVDGVLLVIQHRKHPKAVSTRAKAMVENVGGNLIGVVLNNINISRDYSYYYYGHYYSYAYTRARPEGGAARKGGEA